ncbi:MAG: GNAT family N-acetyltransferase [Sporichthyaceae bacterium]|nr:GNAT family N-acetyltransferase [Sporichthyaceae bacterium]
MRIRATRSDDLTDLADMWTELQEAGGRLARALGRGDFGQRLAEMAKYRNGRLLVAEIDGELVGMAFVLNQSLVPMVETVGVHVGFIHVRSAHRGRGVGKSLIAGVLDYADEVGAAQVSVAVDPNMRDANRFFARLGMRPLMTHRSTSVSVLRRRLAANGLRAEVAHDLNSRRRRFLGRSRIRAAMTRRSDREDGHEPAADAAGEERELPAPVSRG